MGLRIGTNTQSIAAQRNLGMNNHEVKRSQEKLAAGARIVRAADDAAGLAISESMRGQIRSIRQNVRNASDGISLVQTAEGGLNEIGNILIRFRELSIQAASDTIGDAERGMVNKEVQELASEVDRIAKTTEFNGIKLLTGDMPEMEIQVGAKNDPEVDRFKFDTSKLSATLDKLGLSGINTESKAASQENLEKVDNALRTLSESRATLGATQNRMQSTVNNLQIYDENLSSARSRIYDVDMASESSELVKNNILSTVSTAVLGQANQNATLALKLI